MCISHTMSIKEGEVPAKNSCLLLRIVTVGDNQDTAYLDPGEQADPRTSKETIAVQFPEAREAPSPKNSDQASLTIAMQSAGQPKHLPQCGQHSVRPLTTHHPSQKSCSLAPPHSGQPFEEITSLHRSRREENCMYNLARRTGA